MTLPEATALLLGRFFQRAERGEIRVSSGSDGHGGIESFIDFGRYDLHRAGCPRQPYPCGCGTDEAMAIVEAASK